MSARKPLATTCAIISASQSSPAVTCSPWHPTRVKNADRKALRCGAGAAGDHVGELANLESEEAAPSTQVTPSQRSRYRARSRIDRQRHHPAGEARGEQAGGLERDADWIEQLARRSVRPRSACTSTA